MKRAQSVMLVHPGTDDRYEEVRSGYRKTPPPLGLVILAELARHTFPNVKVRVIDGNYTSLQEIKSAISSNAIDLLGLTDWFTNHETCLEIAKFAKSCQPDCQIVLGGPNAGHLARQILTNRKYVDWVVAEDGEDAFLAILAGAESRSVPNLHFREGHEVFSSTHASRDLNTIPPLRFDYPDLREVMQPYDSRRTDYDPEQLAPFSLSSIRGCIKAAKSERCSYCSIPGKNVRAIEPKQFWNQVELLQREYGIEYFFETGDEFCVGSYPQRLLAAKPADLNPRFRVYIQPANLTPGNLKTLSQLGVVSAFVGIEHVSPTILSLAKKPYDTTRVRKSLDLMLDHGIRPLLAFLFGLPGETNESARRNADFALELVHDYGNQIQRLLLTVAVPTVGCEWFNDLARDSELRSDYLQAAGCDLLQNDLIDYEALTRISVAKRSEVDWAWLNQTVHQAQAQSASILGRHKITTFGVPKMYSSEMLAEGAQQAEQTEQMVLESHAVGVEG